MCTSERNASHPATAPYKATKKISGTPSPSCSMNASSAAITSSSPPRTSYQKRRAGTMAAAAKASELPAVQTMIVSMLSTPA